MKLWLLEGPWYSAVVRAPSADEALEIAAEGAAVDEWLGWRYLGHDSPDMNVRELELKGPAGVLYETTG